MNRLQSGVSAKSISVKTVKICMLCGTLNHLDNAECWTCRWHGEFTQDEQTIALAWQRLETVYEEVRLEHVTSRKMWMLEDLGAPHPRSRRQKLVDCCRAWWSDFQGWRDRRLAQSRGGLRSCSQPLTSRSQS